jgi:hypothetical protein
MISFSAWVGPRHGTFQGVDVATTRQTLKEKGFMRQVAVWH